LRFLFQLSKELGLPYEQYAAQLNKMEREQEALDINVVGVFLKEKKSEIGGRISYKSDESRSPRRKQGEPKRCTCSRKPASDGEQAKKVIVFW